MSDLKLCFYNDILGLTPFIILIFLNISVYRKLKRMQVQSSCFSKEIPYALTGLQVEDGGTDRRDRTREREVKLSQVSLVIVFGKLNHFQQERSSHLSSVSVFIFCHSVKWIPNLWEIRQAGLEVEIRCSDWFLQANLLLQEEEVDWPLWIEYITHTSHLLTTVNGTVNVLIYFVKHRSTFPSLIPSIQTETVEFNKVKSIMVTLNISVLIILILTGNTGVLHTSSA